VPESELMEFLNYKAIRAKRKGLIFKKPSLEEAALKFNYLARQLDDHKQYAGLCYLAITSCHGKSDQVGALLNAARAFSKASYEIISPEDHIQAAIWAYSEALLICDRSFIKPIRLEMGRFYEERKMYQQAAECFKQSMSISRCVYNLILSKRYKSALDELKNCPSHLMSTKDHTSMFLLELLLSEDLGDTNRNSLTYLATNSCASTTRGSLPTDDRMFDLNSLLESLLIFRDDKKSLKRHDFVSKSAKMRNTITNRLSAFLDQAQIQILYCIMAQANNCVQ